MQQIKLLSEDGVSVTVDSEIVKKCMKTIKALLDEKNFDPEEEIPIPEVNGKVLKKIIDWVIHYNGEPPAYKEAKDITEWDRNFLEVDNNILFGIIDAANYLQITGLLELCHVYL